MSVSVDMDYYTCRECGGTYAYTENYRYARCPYCLRRSFSLLDDKYNNLYSELETANKRIAGLKGTITRMKRAASKDNGKHDIGLNGFNVALVSDNGRKIQAIKFVREAAGWGLKEAKEYVDHRLGAPFMTRVDNNKVDKVRSMSLKWGFDIKVTQA
jgi:ribosomal protein L7/L12